MKLHPSAELNLKLLTIKTLTLIALSSSDRGQTLHLMKIDNVAESPTGIDFVIFDPIKTTKRVLKPKIISCITTENEALNVCHYVKEYMTRTSPLREEAVSKGNEMPKQLFLSWVTKKPVTKQTLARWLRLCLDSAGIDSKKYGAHSIRGAGLSSAYNHGASINQIIDHGNWTNTNTFHRFYNAPENDSNVGKIILNQYKGGKQIISNCYFSYICIFHFIP